MKASHSFNSRRTVPISSFAVSGGGETINLSLLTPNSEGARRSFRRFDIELSREECQRLHEMLGRRIGADSLAKTVVHGLAVGLGFAAGEKYLPGPKTDCAIEKTGKGGAA